VTLEQVLVLAVFLLVVLVDMAARYLRSRRAAAVPVPEPEPVTFPPVARPPAAARLAAPVPARRRRPEAGVQPMPDPRPTAFRRRPALPGGLAEARRGIVLMTVLGPCRALEPPEPPA
jgi:hypothetical protein